MVRQARPCGAGPQRLRPSRRSRSRSFSVSLSLSLFLFSLPSPSSPFLFLPSSPHPRRGHAARLYRPLELPRPGEGHPALLQRLRPPARGRSQKRVSERRRSAGPGPGPSMSRPLPRGAGARWRPGGERSGDTERGRDTAPAPPPPDRASPPHSYGFVEFEDSRDADDAVYELNGKDLCGERVIVEHARGPRRDRDGYSYSSRSESGPVPPRGARGGGGQGRGRAGLGWHGAPGLGRGVVRGGYPVHRWRCSVFPPPQRRPRVSRSSSGRQIAAF